ncbi:MAG: hypothetical protein ABJG99_14830 [Crocinitomicaceae bacterium]
MKKLLYILSFLWIVGPCFGQPTNFTTNDYYKHQRKEIFFGVGATNVLSDLGGLNRVGTDYSFIDLEWGETRFGAHLGFRYRLRPLWSTKTILQYGWFSGDDKRTQEPYRHNRNLNFSTHMVELSQHLEFIIFNNEHFGKRHSIKGLRGMRNKNTLIYAFSGITGFLYMPMAKGGPFLRPIGTEGQGKPGGPKKYGLFNYGVPFGMGCKIGIDALWRMTFELSYTKTFTDYFDDVSGVYYDFEGNGFATPAEADPSSGAFATWTDPGEIRGDSKQKDAYFFFNISAVRNITYKRTKKIKWKFKARY